MTEHEDLETEIDDFLPEEICELLAESGADLSLEEAEALARFVKEAGGVNPALEAIAQAAER